MTFLSTQRGSPPTGFLAIVAAVAVLGAISCSATAGQSCTVMACQTVASLSTTLDIPRPIADLLAITACRNAVCGTTTIQLGASGQLVTRPTTGPSVALRLTDAKATTSSRAFIDVLGENADVKDGDVYRITVEDRTGAATLLDVTTSPARYATVQPNGAACDQEYHCLQSTLTTR